MFLPGGPEERLLQAHSGAHSRGLSPSPWGASCGEEPVPWIRRSPLLCTHACFSDLPGYRCLSKLARLALSPHQNREKRAWHTSPPRMLSLGAHGNALSSLKPCTRPGPGRLPHTCGNSSLGGWLGGRCHRAGGQVGGTGQLSITQQARRSCAPKMPREGSLESWQMLRCQQGPCWVPSGLTMGGGVGFPQTLL